MSRVERSSTVVATTEAGPQLCERSHLVLTVTSCSEAHTHDRPTGPIERKGKTVTERRAHEADHGRSNGHIGRTAHVPSAPETARNDGFRKIRRMSNWSLAGLVVGMGATTGALAAATHSKAVGTAAVTTTVTGTPTSATGAVQGGPTLASPVATTSPSGVTVSTAAAGGGSATHASTGRVTPAVAGDS